MNVKCTIELIEVSLLSIMIIFLAIAKNIMPIYMKNDIRDEYNWKTSPKKDVFNIIYILAWIYSILPIIFIIVNYKFYNLIQYFNSINEMPILGFSLQWFALVITISGICVSMNNKSNFLINKQDIFYYKKVYAKMVIMLTLFIIICIFQCILINKDNLKDIVYNSIYDKISFLRLINAKIILCECILFTFIFHFCVGTVVILNVLEICFYSSKKLEYKQICHLSQIQSGYINEEDINYNGGFSTNYLHLIRNIEKMSIHKKMKGFTVMNSYVELMKSDKILRRKFVFSLIVQRNIFLLFIIIVTNCILIVGNVYGAIAFEIISIVIFLLVIILFVLLFSDRKIKLLEYYLNSYISKHPIIVFNEICIISDLPFLNKKFYNTIISTIIYVRAMLIYFREKYGENKMFNKFRDLLFKFKYSVDSNIVIFADKIISAIELYTFYHLIRAKSKIFSPQVDKKIYYNLIKKIGLDKDCNQIILQLFKLNAYYGDYQIYKNIIKKI